MSGDSANTATGSSGHVPLGFGGLHASVGDHIGHFYEAEDGWKDALVPFLATGLAAGEKCVCISHQRQAVSDALQGAGVDVAAALSSGQLLLDEGKASPKGMQEMLRLVLSQLEGSTQLLRWVGDMTWSLRKLPTTENLMVWESHCNTVGDAPAVFLCQYELSAFQGNVIMDALKTHPLCVVNNAIHRNPYFQDPDVFLEELRSGEPTPVS